MDAGGNLGVLVDDLKVGVRPRGAEPHDLGRSSVIVALLGRKRCVLAVEGAGRVASVDAAEAVPGRIYLHRGV